MKEKTLGMLIENTRSQKKISKKELSRGICSITALTRYEQDERIPDKFIIDALLERLGLNPFKYEFITSDREFNLSMYRQQIDQEIAKKQIETAFQTLRKYENELHRNDSLHFQYLFLKKAELSIVANNLISATKLLKKALDCTKCLYTRNDNNLQLCDVELECLYSLAECLYQQGTKDIALDIFSNIYNYMIRMHWSAEKTGDHFPKILYRLAESEAKDYNFGQAYRHLKEAEDYIVNGYRIDNLYDILVLKHEVENKIGIGSTRKNDRDFLIALKIISMSDNGIITKEGIDLWENTVNQQS